MFLESNFMKNFLLILLFFIFSLTQSTFFTTPVRPDLVLALIVCAAVYEKSRKAIVLAALAGCIESLFFPDIFYFYLICLPLTALLIALLKEKLFYENIFFPMFLCAVFTVFGNLVFYSLSFLYKDAHFFIFKDIIMVSLLNAAFAAPIYYLYGYFFVSCDKIKI